MHTAVPVASELYVPPGQAVHTTELEAPGAGAYAPAPQATQAAEDVAPYADEYVPGGQAAHAAPPMQYVPGAQG